MYLLALTFQQESQGQVTPASFLDAAGECYDCAHALVLAREESAEMILPVPPALGESSDRTLPLWQALQDWKINLLHV